MHLRPHLGQPRASVAWALALALALITHDPRTPVAAIQGDGLGDEWRSLQHHHNIGLCDNFLSSTEVDELLQLGRDAVAAEDALAAADAEGAEDMGALYDRHNALARTVRLDGADRPASVRGVQERIASLVGVAPELVGLAFAEGQLPAADQERELEYGFTHVVHDLDQEPAAFSMQVFLTDQFDGGSLVFPCHQTGAALPADTGEATAGSRLRILQSFLAGESGLFADGIRRWEAPYNNTAQTDAERHEQLRRAGGLGEYTTSSRISLARVEYVNSFCRQNWPEVGAHTFPLMVRPASGSAVLWANVRHDLTVDPFAWHVDCHATAPATEPRAVLHAVVRMPAEGPGEAVGWQRLLVPVGGSMMDAALGQESATKTRKKKREGVETRGGQKEDL